jgi:hypothetical protein
LSLKERKHETDNDVSSGGEPENKLETDDAQAPVVTPGLTAHLAYCKANSISKERAIGAFLQSIQPIRPRSYGEELLDVVEFEKDLEISLWEYVFALVNRCNMKT